MALKLEVAPVVPQAEDEEDYEHYVCCMLEDNAVVTTWTFCGDLIEDMVDSLPTDGNGHPPSICPPCEATRFLNENNPSFCPIPGKKCVQEWRGSGNP